MGAFNGVDWVAIIGLAVAIGGFFVNLYFKAKENRRAEEIHEMRKQQIKKGKCYED